MRLLENLKKDNYRFLFILLVFVCFIHFLFRAYQYKDNYLVKYDPEYWEWRYYQSQWVVPDSKITIGDDGLYAYAGYKYVFDGLNPILNSAEVPPLGKYLVGYTIFIFGNQNVFGLITGIAVLIVYFLFNLTFFKNKLLAFLPVFVFSLDQLFWEQLQANYFDLLYLTFLFLSLMFTLKRKYFIASLFVGLFAATKFPPSAVLVTATMFAYVLLNYRFEILRLLISFILVPVVFIASHAKFFALGNDLGDFLKVLKYFVNYYTTGAKSQNHLMAFEMLLLGRWSTWWEGVVRISEWTILWPISFFVTLFTLKDIKKNIKSPIFINLLWILVYSVFLLLVPVAPRYLLLLIPFLYNISVWVLLKSIDLKSS